MTSLHRWAASQHDLDVVSSWTATMESHGPEAIELDPALVPHVTRINGQTAMMLALLSLSRAAQAIADEHRSVDPATVRRWAKS